MKIILPSPFASSELETPGAACLVFARTPDLLPGVPAVNQFDIEQLGFVGFDVQIVRVETHAEVNLRPCWHEARFEPYRKQSDRQIGTL